MVFFFVLFFIYFFYLLSEYGAVDEDELKKPENSVKSTLVEVIIEHDGRQIKKKLPRTILIQKLIMLVSRLFSLKSKPRLLYICATQPDIQIELDDEGKELGRYSVNDGDKIIAVT